MTEAKKQLSQATSNSQAAPDVEKKFLEDLSVEMRRIAQRPEATRSRSFCRQLSSGAPGMKEPASDWLAHAVTTECKKR